MFEGEVRKLDTRRETEESEEVSDHCNQYDSYNIMLNLLLDFTSQN